MEFSNEKLIAVTTDAGLDAAIDARNEGIEARISHIAFGDAANNRYKAYPAQTQLARERVRVPIAGGERIGRFEFMVQALLDTGPEFNINEVGFFLDDGTMIAIWADKDFTLAVKSIGTEIAIAYNIALAGIPPGSVTLNISGPSVNLTIIRPIAQTAADFMRTWRRMVQTDVRELTPTFENIWR